MATMRNLAVLETLQAQAVSTPTTINGSDMDLMGYVNPGGREIKAILSANAISGTSPTLDVKVQESDTGGGSGYSDISGAAFTQVTTVDSKQEIHFRTKKRYIRMVATTTGTSPTYQFCGLFLVEKRLT